MMSNAIKVYGEGKDVLSVELKDVLDCVTDGEEYEWSILWLEAIGNTGRKTMVEMETQVKSSKEGFKIDWKSLIDLANQLDQVIEILLIGDKNAHKLKRYSSNEEMYSNCYCTIELIDSSYWIIHSKSNAVLNRMKSNLLGVETI